MIPSPPTLTQTVLIRPMKPEDMPQVLEIDRMSFSLPWPESTYRYELYENPLSLLLVAEAVPSNGKTTIVGIIVIWLILDEAHIATLAVHHDHRRLGIARQMLVVALKDVIRKGCVLATLEVRAHNTVAQELYRRFGFEIVGNRPRYYRDNNEDAIIMTVKSLGENYIRWLENDCYIFRSSSFQPEALPTQESHDEIRRRT